jgi:periplasmic divalent cation tolerance protein
VDAEALIIFKTTAAGLEALKKRVLELHPYDVPEFLALEITDGHLPYLQWVRDEVDDRGRS